jgi:hypothetical protein
MTGSPVALDPGEMLVPLPLALAVEAARVALDHATDLCRFHGDVPPAKPGSWASACGSCEQPARVRKALALLRRVSGEQPPPRRYVVDGTTDPHPVSGLYPVVGIRGLFAPADPERAGAVIVRELEVRGELGPFDVLVTVKGGTHEH